MGKTVVLATFGSLGDLHPYMALGLGLQARGCRAIIATHELYRSKVEATGLGFRPLRPEYDIKDRDANRAAMDPWRGTEVILRQGLIPFLRETYDDLAAAIKGADLLVSHTIVFPAPILAEVTGIPWVSTVLAPIAFLSAYDPPRAAPVPWINHIWSLGPGVNRAVVRLMRWKLDAWCEPIYELRRELGLGRGAHPLFEGQHSPGAKLALFSRLMGAPQPDWPLNTKQTGFLFYDQPQAMPPGLEEFLNDGEPPIVFTLGSAAVINPGSFFTESAKAARLLGRRAVLLVGANEFPASADIFVAPYAPYSRVFPKARAMVHQGGIGTTAQGLRSGTPSLIVPFAHDQPDNAARVMRIGAGRSVTLSRYRAAAVAHELSRLESCRAAAAGAAREIEKEDGVGAACEALL